MCRMRLSFKILAICATSCLISVAHGQQPKRITITGTLTDETGKGLNGVRVYALAEQGTFTNATAGLRTKADGAYTLELRGDGFTFGVYFGSVACHVPGLAAKDQTIHKRKVMVRITAASVAEDAAALRYLLSMRARGEGDVSETASQLLREYWQKTNPDRIEASLDEQKDLSRNEIDLIRADLKFMREMRERDR